MKPTSRLYQCIRCHKQTIICSCCDRGQIYCGKICSILARNKLIKAARVRYQLSFKGKRKHAACQARYRLRLSKKVMDQGSPKTPPHDLIHLTENKTNMLEKNQNNSILRCCFCRKKVSEWLRNDFIRRRGNKKSAKLRPCSQAP